MKTLPTGYATHDAVAEELFEKQSVAALVYLIDHGRELELTLGDRRYFISRDRAEKYVDLWDGDDRQSFDSMEALVENATVAGKPFLSVWPQFRLDCLL